MRADPPANCLLSVGVTTPGGERRTLPNETAPSNREQGLSKLSFNLKGNTFRTHIQKITFGGKRLDATVHALNSLGDINEQQRHVVSTRHQHAWRETDSSYGSGTTKSLGQQISWIIE